MSALTTISWCDSTINFWSGCTMVLDISGGLKESGCAFCYAKDRDNRHMIEPVSHWGKGKPRLKHTTAIDNALALNRRPWICNACGFAVKEELSNCPKCDADLVGFHRRRIFSLSLGDWLDTEVPIEWLSEMLDTIRQCDQMTWILCTKRPENWKERLAKALTCVMTHGPVTDERFAASKWVEEWLNGTPPKNIILLASVENQAMADLRIPQLLNIPAACRGLSLEPLLSPVDLSKWIWKDSCGCTENEPEPGGGFKCKHCKDTGAVTELDWIIIGGESGPRARPCNVEWMSNLVAQGKAAGIPTFVKQLGAKPFIETCPHCGHPETSHGYGRTVGCQHGDGSEANPICGCRKMRDEICHGLGWPMAHHPVKDKKGSDPEEWPDKLRIQQFPTL